MIGKRSIRDQARHFPDDVLTIERSGGRQGFYIMASNREALELHTLRSECVAVLQATGYTNTVRKRQWRLDGVQMVGIDWSKGS